MRMLKRKDNIGPLHGCVLLWKVRDRTVASRPRGRGKRQESPGQELIGSSGTRRIWIRRRWRPGCAVITGARRGCERSDKDHWTPLHSASYYGKPEIVRVFLNHGAKANAENDDGETPLT
jgi:hypothetical protein